MTVSHDLSLQLEKAVIVNYHYVGAVCFTSPSPSALRLMLLMCSAKSHSLTFNTQLIKFSRCSSSSKAEFVFGGQKLAFCE